MQSGSKWVRKASFFLVALLHQKWWFWSLGFLQGWFVPIWQGNRVLCPVGQKPRSIQGLVGDSQKRATAGSSFWAQPNPDYPLGTGQSPISICKLEQDLGWKGIDDVFQDSHLGLRTARLCWITPDSLNFEVFLTVEGRDFWVPDHCLPLSLRVSSGLNLHTTAEMCPVKLFGLLHFTKQIGIFSSK